jgi:hypothetical protein
VTRSAADYDEANGGLHGQRGRQRITVIGRGQRPIVAGAAKDEVEGKSWVAWDEASR